MDISVVICTCDRLASLERVIASAAEMSVDGVAWELLIVDNGRGGEVEKVVDRYKARLPLRMEREPETGLSSAPTGLKCWEKCRCRRGDEAPLNPPPCVPLSAREGSSSASPGDV
jgi:glycosyltransferase involved in cell wall biosynthesis